MAAMDVAVLSAEARQLAKAAQAASQEDSDLEVRGIVWMEHVNLVTGGRALAEAFYLDGLGLTRDPDRVGGVLWVNVGPRQQLHLVDPAEGDAAQVVDGCIGLALPDLPALLDRLRAVSPRLSEPAVPGSRFAFAELDGGAVGVDCPWGNRFYVYSSAAEAPAAPPAERPAKRARRTVMEALHEHVDAGMAVRAEGREAGIRFVHWRCAHAGHVASFYEEIFGSVVWRSADHALAAVCVGPSVHLLFSSAPEPRDAEAAKRAQGIHVCVYVCEFRRAHDRLRERGLIWTNPRWANLDSCDSFEDAAAGRQFRFKLLKDTGSGEDLAELEHEVRSLRHLQFMKSVPYVAK